LDFIRVNDASNIGVGKERFWKFVSFLLLCPAVHFLKSRFRPNDKAAKVTTRSQLEKVERIHVTKLNSR